MSNTTAFAVQRLRPSDISRLEAMVRLFHEVFEMEEPITATQAQWQRLLENPTFVALVAVADDQVVGGLTAYELPMYYTVEPELFIYDIAIKADYQRQGVGKQLLAEAAAYCRERGIRVMFVDASEEDDHAVAFYHATGGTSEQVVQFSYEVDQ